MDTSAVVTASSAAGREAFPGYPGWRVLLASFIGLAFSPGPLIFGSFGVLAPHLRADFGWSLGQIMLALTVFNVASVLAAPYTGRLIDRHGVRAILFPSLLLLVAGFMGVAWFVNSLPSFYLLATLWGALTVGTQSISYTKLLTLWFERRRGLAVGIAAAGLGLGYSLVPLLVTRLLAGMDWRAALTAIAAAVAVVPVGVNLLFAHPRENNTTGAAGAALPGLTLEQARSTAAFWQMAGAILLASIALTGVVPHIVLFGREHGLSATTAAQVAAAYGISTIAGRVLVGALADRLFVPVVAMGFFGISALGFLAAGLVGSDASLAILTCVALTIGLGFGAESDVIALLISRYFGQRNFGSIYGVLLAAFLVGASIGPPLFGFGHDRLGTYSPLMIGAAAVMVMALALLSRLPRV